VPFKAPLTSVSLIETGTKEAGHSTLMLPPIERNVFVIQHMSQDSLLAIFALDPRGNITAEQSAIWFSTGCIQTGI
jgi:hypothetical protein